MSERFVDKVAVITGGASGIGAATARRLVSEGASVVLGDLQEEATVALAQELGDSVIAHVIDVTNLEAVEAMMAEAVNEFGHLDIVFNNAGISSFGRVDELDIDEWHRVIDVDLNAVFYGCRAALPHLRANGGGAIVNTASISGLFGDWGLPAYNAAKGAVMNLTRALAADHARDGIRVNAVCPGGVVTAMTDSLANSHRAQEHYERLVPMARMGQADEIASAVAFLASDDASYVTGHGLVVDGGVTATTGQPNFSALAERWW
ncbi:MAG: SDR family NAD(P)-dependent oxidoreductase [Acidimicrobiales bacterium]|jgi:meso-butanediol dehydrogenase/(S,S)-butanediol dehydrogenase/diacetyl reductase